MRPADELGSSQCCSGVEESIGTVALYVVVLAQCAHVHVHVLFVFPLAVSCAVVLVLSFVVLRYRALFLSHAPGQDHAEVGYS